MGSHPVIYSRTNVAQFLVSAAILALLDLVPAAVEKKNQGQRNPNWEGSDGNSGKDPGGLAMHALAADAIVDGQERCGLAGSMELVWKAEWFGLGWSV